MRRVCGNVRERRETNTQVLVEKPGAKKPLGILSAKSQDSVKELNRGLWIGHRWLRTGDIDGLL